MNESVNEQNQGEEDQKGEAPFDPTESIPNQALEAFASVFPNGFYVASEINIGEIPIVYTCNLFSSEQEAIESICDNKFNSEAEVICLERFEIGKDSFTFDHRRWFNLTEFGIYEETTSVDKCLVSFVDKFEETGQEGLSFFSLSILMSGGNINLIDGEGNEVPGGKDPELDKELERVKALSNALDDLANGADSIKGSTDAVSAILENLEYPVHSKS